MSDWQPIETAPVGVATLVLDFYGDISVAQRGDDGWTAIADGKFLPATVPNAGSDYLMVFPSHWMPLPSPPLTN